MKWEHVDAVIFDLGGVIINLDYNLTIQAFEQLGIENFSGLYTQLSQSTVFDHYETGKISSQQFINKLLDHLPTGTSPNKVVAAWNAMILDVPRKKTEMLKLLNDDKQIFLLSNTNEIHMQKVRRAWSLATDLAIEEHFTEVYLSYEMGLRKPERAIFQKVCADHNLDPGKTLFIDDSPQHIEGAKSVGLETIHLTDSEAFYTLFS